jgi:hypothetical protein
MPPAGFKPTILARVVLQTHALDRAATGIGDPYHLVKKFAVHGAGKFTNLKSPINMPIFRNSNDHYEWPNTQLV